MALPFWLRPLQSAVQRNRASRARWSRRKARGRTRLSLELLEDRTLLNAYVVTTTADSGAGSLRDAITKINADTSHALYASPSNPNVDEIDFNITAVSDILGGGTGFNATTGVATITPVSALPAITNSVIINGYTQPGAQPNTLLGVSPLGSTDSTHNPSKYGDNAVLKIELAGENAGAGATGLMVDGNNDTVQGLVVNRFDLVGIEVGGNSTVQGNFIGTDVTGEVALGNHGAGVLLSGGGTLGGSTPASRNIVSGTTGSPAVNNGNPNVYGGNGVASGPGNLIEGNFIGTDATGTKPLGNVRDGVFVYAQGGSHVTISNNVIDASGAYGINDGDQYNSGDLIQGNFIGTDVTGTKLANPGPDGIMGTADDLPLGNAEGLFIQGVNDTIGGTTQGTGNLISGNDGGIDLRQSGTLVQGNFIGTDVTGTYALGNATGIGFADSGSNNTIGGTAAGAGNLISGNGTGVFINGQSGNVFQGNLLGTDLHGQRGTLPGWAVSHNPSGGLRPPVPVVGLGNQGGISVATGSTNNTIGGTAAGAGNVIDYSVGPGLTLNGSDNQVLANSILSNGNDGIQIGGSGNTITGNTISSNGTNTAHAYAGVELVAGDNNVISSNTISGNNNRGVYVGGSTGGSGNKIISNSISSNLDMGILLDSTAVGTVVQGNSVVRNAGIGVRMTGAVNSLIGGPALRDGNVIAYNGGDGVNITRGNGNTILHDAIFSNQGDGVLVQSGTGNVISQNAIFSNRLLGIELYFANNANNDQSAPVLTSAVSSGSGTTITGTLQSTPNRTFTVELFTNPVSSASQAQGAIYLGSVTVTTDASGKASFSKTFAFRVPAGQFITATATENASTDDPDSDTSQFSNAVAVTSH
ncbi:MAG TPA: right-handed parallel beta-helix repeat-containing protein [Gemmataceae bacterium]|nr:right-handed parallel beta-helix repeat-containing protein [Gemmataceae bacterium]